MSAPNRVVTFGCRLNTLESQAMHDAATAAGLAGTTIVNTCAVTAEAVRQARQAIRRAARENPGAPIVVSGCAAEVERERFAAMPGVTAVLPNRHKAAPEAWRRLAGRPAGTDLPEGAAPGVGLPPGEGIAGRTRAFVQVQNGCDHRCTFCIIPFGRGESRSVPAADVVAQVRRLVASGHAEVVLTGVDITSWGADIEGGPQLGRLVRTILAEVPELRRLRLSSIDSVEADPELIEAMADEPRLMPHLHLSLQAGDDLILKRMKRRHLRADAIRLTARLRALRPEIVFGADFIVGFPTESEAMFARTLDLVEECGLTFLHVFPFSPRPGTPAARMPQVPAEVARERAARLRALGSRRLAAHLASRTGEVCEVLAEKPDFGRAETFVPVRLAGPAEPGHILTVRLEDHDGERFLGRPLAA